MGEDRQKLPRHVAIIMDGNGRWAVARGLPRQAGHLVGVEAVRRAVRHASEVGIEYLTLFAFSSENWRRPAQEIGYLSDAASVLIPLDEIDRHPRNQVIVLATGSQAEPGRRDDRLAHDRLAAHTPTLEDASGTMAP